MYEVGRALGTGLMIVGGVAMIVGIVVLLSSAD